MFEWISIQQREGDPGRLINADAVRAIYLVVADPNAYYEYSAY
jgi:hypothetical protein